VLPANGPSSTTWFLVGKEGQNLGYKYKDSLLLHGPVKALAVKTGKQLKLTAKGSGLSHTLVANPNPVDVVVTMGSARYCQRYGGTVVFKTPTSFTAKLAPAPSACP
jgi:hypothetical protein